MKMVICAIYDTKAEAYSQPMFFQAVGQALRSFIDAVSDERDGNNNFAKHPEDYNLFRLGTFDDQSGEIISEAPTHLGNGLTMKATIDGPRLAREA